MSKYSTHQQKKSQRKRGIHKVGGKGRIEHHTPGSEIVKAVDKRDRAKTEERVALLGKKLESMAPGV